MAAKKLSLLDLFIALGLGAAAWKAFGTFFNGEGDESLLGLDDLKKLPGNVPKGHHFVVQSLEERIDLLQELTMTGRHDPKVIALARKAVSKRCGDRWCIDERDYDREVEAIFNAAKENVRYVRDVLDADTFAHPKWALEFGGEDCDGEVVVLASMLGAIGYPTKFRVIQTRGEQDWNHIYLLVGLPPDRPSKWVSLDLTEPHAAGWEVPKSEIVRLQDFEVRTR